MTPAVASAPRVVHALPGRLRLHLPAWSGAGRRELEARLRAVAGVRRVAANPLTATVLVLYEDEPSAVVPERVTAVARAFRPPPGPAGTIAAPDDDTPPAFRERAGGRVGSDSRARIAVRGIERDPALARRVVERLEQRPGVRAVANPLTGRVLVEYDERATTLDDLVWEVADLEAPPSLSDERPAHPLDALPLAQGATRLAAALGGLVLLAALQLRGAGGGLRSPGAARIAAFLSLMQGIPVTRRGLRALLGRDVADVTLALPGILLMTLAGSSLGLALAAADALQLFAAIRARREAWREYEARLDAAPSPHPGTTLRLESGERAPLAAVVLTGTGTVLDAVGSPVPLAVGSTVSAGARVLGGPFVVQLRADDGFAPPTVRAPTPRARWLDDYLRAIGPLSLAYATALGIRTRSFGGAFAALLLLNARPALLGAEAADAGAEARVVRSGATVVGTRRARVIRRPDLLMLDAPRLLTSGLELVGAEPLRGDVDDAEILRRAAGVSMAAGSPWGGVFRTVAGPVMSDGSFDGRVARAAEGDTRSALACVEDPSALPAAIRLRHATDTLLLLYGANASMPLGVIVLRPRLAPQVRELVDTCHRCGVELRVVDGGAPARARSVAQRAGVTLVGADAGEAIEEARACGKVVAYVGDGPRAGAAFEAADLAIGLTSSRGHFAARADVLAPDLGVVAAIVDTGARRDAAVRDAVALSVGANVAGVAWGLRASPDVARASRIAEAAGLASLAAGWLRLHGEDRRAATIAITDPHPERWGRHDAAEVLAALDATPNGLTNAQATARLRSAPPPPRRSTLLHAILVEARSPLTAVLAAGAGVSLFMGARADVLVIGATLAANALVSAWQSHRANQVTEALEQMGAGTARVLRDGRVVALPGDALVPGDVLVLRAGERLGADARLLEADGLEVDEAALTGESLPVRKRPNGDTEAERVVLAGSDVTVGVGTAVVVAVGDGTRMGAIAAALALERAEASPLALRLAGLVREVVPAVVIGGGVAALAGVAWGHPLVPQLAMGASIALAAFPEGLPLLAAIGQAAVARRLAARRALVHRPTAVEALGRVDVACVDKTGTLTEGRLAVHVVADIVGEATLPQPLSAGLRRVLVVAAVASPHPDAEDAGAHATDAAVLAAASAAGLEPDARVHRTAEARFDPARSFHASVAGGRLCVKGAPEVLLARCDAVRRGGRRRPLSARARAALLERAHRLAASGLRVLLVAEGPEKAAVEDPRHLTAVGFVGISDPLRAGVAAAVRRCQEAGVRVVMLTGDHPVTATTIARQAGLLDGGDFLTGHEIAELENGELDARLERVTVVARATPLDKLRIVESLQRRGHAVAMTGDGVNDAPALRLADVGVAMGKDGTEVARRAADVVLADDDFSTLVEALVEGRGFWHNVRSALGLLLGGNLGELSLVMGASVLGAAPPLTVRQILATNLITDALPALAVVTQPPEHRDLATLAREGAAALDAPLRRDILRRAVATAAPATAAYLLALRAGSLPQARSVAFASIVGTQLAQTLAAGWADGTLSPTMLGAVGASGGALVALLAVPAFRSFFQLAPLSPIGLALAGGSALVAPVVSRALLSAVSAGPSRPMSVDWMRPAIVS